MKPVIFMAALIMTVTTQMAQAENGIALKVVENATAPVNQNSHAIALGKEVRTIEITARSGKDSLTLRTQLVKGTLTISEQNSKIEEGRKVNTENINYGSIQMKDVAKLVALAGLQDQTQRTLLEEILISLKTGVESKNLVPFADITTVDDLSNIIERLNSSLVQLSEPKSKSGSSDAK